MIKKIPHELQDQLNSSSNLKSITDVVEELFLNSIDANSDVIDINIDLHNRSVMISDSGNGIPLNNLTHIPQKFLTNKIQKIEDLKTSNFKLYGFKGISLFFISKICKMVISSKVRSSYFGYKKIIKNEKSEIELDKTCQIGTTVICKDIFYNIPVRVKQYSFCGDKMSEIIDLIRRYHVVHPHISVFVRNENNQLVYCENNNIFKNRERNKISTEKVICKMLKLDEKELLPIYISSEGIFGKIKIYGYMNNPNFYKEENEEKSTEEIQYLYLNKKIVKENYYSLGEYIKKTYYSFLGVSSLSYFSQRTKDTKTVRERVNFVINICIDNKKGELFDYIHGYNLREKKILFFDNKIGEKGNVVQEIKKLLKKMIEKYFCEKVKGFKEYIQTKKKDDNTSSVDNKKYREDVYFGRTKIFSKSMKKKEVKIKKQSIQELLKKSVNRVRSNRVSDEYEMNTKKRKRDERSTFPDEILKKVKMKEEVYDSVKLQDPSKKCICVRDNITRKDFTETIEIRKEILDGMKVINQLEKKFIVCESKGVLYIFDQHAADERVNLELKYENEIIDFENKKMKEDSKLIYRHKFAMKKKIEIGYEDLNRIENFKKNLENWGWRIMVPKRKISSGNITFSGKLTFYLLESPCICETILSEKEMLEYVKQIQYNGDFVPASIREIIAYKACRGAIKFGDYLSVDKCQEIIDNLGKCKFPFQCAHGRNSILPIFKYK